MGGSPFNRSYNKRKQSPKKKREIIHKIPVETKRGWKKKLELGSSVASSRIRMLYLCLTWVVGISTCFAVVQLPTRFFLRFFFLRLLFCIRVVVRYTEWQWQHLDVSINTFRNNFSADSLLCYQNGMAEPKNASLSWTMHSCQCTMLMQIYIVLTPTN